MHKSIPVPRSCSRWFSWLGQFLADRTVQLSESLSVVVASDWSVRVGKDRQSIVFGATINGTLKLTPEQAAVLNGSQLLPLANGSALQLTKPLTALFNAARVVDGQLQLPEGVVIQVDGAPDPTAQSVFIAGDVATVQLQARVALVPVSITADLVPTP